MLLFPYYPRGTAWDLIVHASSATNKLSNPWPFPEPVALKLFADVCQGVLALHSAGFMHRDVKPLVSVMEWLRDDTVHYHMRCTYIIIVLHCSSFSLVVVIIPVTLRQQNMIH